MKSNLFNMKSLDFYLSSLTNKRLKEVQHEIQPNDFVNSELMSFDIYLQKFHQIGSEISQNKDIEAIKEMSQIFKWSNDFDEIFNENNFEALVLTDISRKILWVNSGFTEMTGYSKKFAVNRTPSFLQGEKTSNEVRKRIQKKLLIGTPFKEIIINHKKDKSTYKCEVKIFPLKSDTTTHFLALEKIAL
ncbi:PAS domain S-box-containing protein [Tenacibaculum sp. MAR_2009_124]|uniref:PAS domain-containing protein n=1 Tax=Tenacibaculum sp. MAR_2009_124 TaxID=1250059 RepID=UPI0008983685|nr:PAS domain-containing protein [Tenacibaculum sp. MAR_2009_124]SEB82745.1 PAS domain S-box-containing protein [Tenacibaculum sp. MAR_2009_124]